MFDNHVITASIRHAESTYPSESCGVVVGGGYVPMTNVHEDPEHNFRMDPVAFDSIAKDVQAVIHSHPLGNDWPTQSDMACQMEMRVPWGITWRAKLGDYFADPFWFGDQVPRQPLLERRFRPGVADCYALLRDWFLAEENIFIHDTPRDEAWWHKGGDLFSDMIRGTGFDIELPGPEKEGDCVIGRILGPVPNHCGVYLGNGLILHHLAARLSRIEPIAPWLRFVNKTYRHKDLA